MDKDFNFNATKSTLNFNKAQDYDETVLPSAIEVESSSKMVPVCRKNTFFVRTSYTFKNKDLVIEMRKLIFHYKVVYIF